MIVTRDSKHGLLYNIACSERELDALLLIVENFFDGAGDVNVRAIIKSFIDEVRMLRGPNSGKGE